MVQALFGDVANIASQGACGRPQGPQALGYYWRCTPRYVLPYLILGVLFKAYKGSHFFRTWQNLLPKRHTYKLFANFAYVIAANTNAMHALLQT